MNYHKLLAKQVTKNLPEELRAHPDLIRLLEAVDQSYQAYERDRELSERAFRISEDEYQEVNQRLKEEIRLKKLSVEKLKETAGLISEGENPTDTDDLLMIARYLNTEVSKRKNAEKVFSSLITNMQSGILLEDETRHIVFTNQIFCDMFGIPVPPSVLEGVDCSNSAEESKALFRDADAFVAGIQTLLNRKKLVTGELLELTDGRVLERDYIPIFLDDQYKGHLWSYTDITERKKATDALEQSELKNRLIMNSALDAILTTDEQGLITFWNPQAEKIFGWRKEEILGKSFVEYLISPDHRNEHEEGMRIYLETGQGPLVNRQHETEAVDRYERTFPVEISVVPVQQDSSYFLCVFIKDISERKKNEKELREYEERFRIALQKIGDNVWEHDFRTEITHFSNSGNSILGYAADTISSNADFWWSRVYEDDRPLLKENDRKYRAGETNHHSLEYRMIDAQGAIRWILDRGVVIEKDKKGKPLRVVGTHTDVTVRKMSEQVLRMNEEKYRNIIANMNLGLLEVDTEDRIQFANNSFCYMSGFSEEELKNKRAADLFAGGDNARFVLEKNSIRKQGVSDAYEIAVRNKRGELKWWLISGAPRFNDKGELIGTIGIHLDITPQKRMEHDLISAREQAEQSARSKEIFLANMSHEIRTPLNAILGMSGQLLKTSLSDQQKFYLDTINSSGEHLLVIINDILDISKIQAGKLHIEHIPFRLSDIGNRVIQVMSHRAEEKGIGFACHSDSRVSPVLMGDPYRLHQVLLNLVSNAIKFTEKGTVKVECRVKQDEEDNQLVGFIVTDTGIGMDKDFASRLFQSFSQEDSTVARKYGGTGLGMAISKQLVELMKGSISVSSEKGKGTQVEFSIPFAKAQESALAKEEETLTNTGILKDKKILLVEDNEMNRLVATTVLDNYETQITEVINGKEAVDRLGKEVFDLVLMDVQMPVMDGLEASRRIRNDLKLSIPIIALTANAIKGESDRCFAAGMNDYLSKPFKEEDLVNIISRWLGKESIRDEKTSPMQENTALYDLSKLYEISNGKRDFVDKMIRLFSSQVPQSVTEIRQAYEAGDLATVKSVAHRIKPSIDNMGITSLTAEIREIERLALEGKSSPELESLIRFLESRIGHVVEELKKAG